MRPRTSTPSENRAAGGPGARGDPGGVAGGATPRRRGGRQNAPDTGDPRGTASNMPTKHDQPPSSLEPDTTTIGAPDPTKPSETGGHRSVLSLLRDIQQGVVTVESLSLDDRRSCVAHLSGQGLSAPEIAEALRIHERTVYRDLGAIRRANALTPNPTFTREIAGMVLRRAEASSSKLLRLARDPKSPPHVQVDAEAKSFEVLSDAVQTLQKMGLLPSAAPEDQEGPAAPSLDLLAGEIDRLLACMGSAGQAATVPQPGMASALEELRQLRAASLTLGLAVRLDVVKGKIAADMPDSSAADAARLPSQSAIDPLHPPPAPPP